MEQNSKKTWNVIKCPHCGAELISAEIFMPGDLIGDPKTIVRDALGRIIYLEYKPNCEPAQPEKYFCDACEKPFIVEPILTFKVKKEAEELDFTEKFVSLI